MAERVVYSGPAEGVHAENGFMAKYGTWGFDGLLVLKYRAQLRALL